MTRSKLLSCGLLLALLACGGGDGGTEPQDDRGSITGSVRNGGAGVAGVSVALSGGGTANATTSGAGAYTFNNLVPGNYTVAITVPGGLELAAGEVASKPATVTANNATTVNFNLVTPAPTTGTVSGSVREGATGVAGATLRLTATGVDRTTTSAANGTYSFADVAPGAYNVNIAPPTGFNLAAGEQADKAANVTAGQTATVNFSVVNASPVQIVNANATSFSPNDVTVSVGTRVRWVNNSGFAHTVTPDGHAEWTSADLANGANFEHVFATAGVYEYLCLLHVGMTGIIRVQ